ncbi:MAG: AI-2E family transporter [Candidatus Vogelbacteria bacterium]|nr:AI-2E family transporter [Candidatus Vogelbacteria bacterium]
MKDSGSELRVHLTSGAIIRLVVWGAFFWLLYFIRDLVLVVLVSVVIASAVEPAVRWFGRWRLPRTPAVLIVYLLAFALLFSSVPLFFIPVFGDLVEISATLPEKLGALPILTAPGGFFSNLSRLNYFSTFSADVQGALFGLSRGFLTTLSVIFGGFFSFIMIVVISFYLAVQDDGIGNFLRLISPASREKYIIDLWHRSEKKIGRWMQGQLLLGLLVGVIVYLGLTVLHIDYALTLALMAAGFELIPVFGPILASAPAILIGLSDSVARGLLVAGLYLIIQQFENHLLYPLVVRKIVGVPAIAVILSLIIGAKLVGFLGLILAVPAATVLMELLSDFEQRKKIGAAANA